MATDTSPQSQRLSQMVWPLACLPACLTTVSLPKRLPVKSLSRMNYSYNTHMSTASLFDEDYYMRGVKTGKSNYTDYRWLGDETIGFCQRMMLYLGATFGDSVLDWGCSRGYYVRALRELRFRAYGYDISKWAIENADPLVKSWVSNGVNGMLYDWIIAKDVLEHVPLGQLPDVAMGILTRMLRGGLIIIPLIDEKTGEYINPADRMDSTHVIAWTLRMWLDFFQDAIDRESLPFTVSGGYKLPGVKTAAEAYPHSTGFLTIRRFHP